MPKLTKNKKIIIGLVSMFLVLGFVFVINAPSAKAAFLDMITSPGTFVMNILAWLAYGFLWLLSRLISVAAFLLEAVFKIEESTGFTKVTVVTRGWEITRGLCNMFFALILLLMAFDTILQLNKFPIKTVLPKLVFVALTINFSLVFLGIIIDFSQILTRYFIDAAGGSSGSIADQLANGLNIAKVFGTPTGDLNTNAEIQKTFGGGTASLLSIFGTLTFGIVVILIAAFAIGAGAIFMLIRLVSLWVLLITAPLAWLAMVAPLPGLSSLTSGWWQKFFKWTFFAPIYSFFIYLAVLVAGTPIFNLTQTPDQKRITGSIFVNNFLSPDNGISLLLQYVVIIIILLTGLQTAQESGVKGAGTVMAWGKKMGDRLKGYAKRPAQFAYDQYAGKTVQGLGNAISGIPFLEKTGNRLKARGVAMETGGEGREQHKAYANVLRTMSDLDLQNEVQHAGGIRKLLAARQAKERGLLEKADSATVQKALATFGAYGLKDDKGKTKEEKDLEDVRFDAIAADLDFNNPADKQKVKDIVRRSKENGNLDKLKPAILENEKAMLAIMDELSPPEFTETFRKWGKKTKLAAETAMVKSFKDDNWKDDNEAKKRELFASVTDKITAAFGNANGKVDLNNPDQMKMLAKYVSKMTAAKVAEIRNPETKKDDLALIGQHASPDLVTGVGRERGANAEQKDMFRAGVENNTVAVNAGVMEGSKANEAKERLKGPGWTVIQEEGKRERRRANEEERRGERRRESEQEERSAGKEVYRPKGINEARARNRQANPPPTA